MGDYQPKRRPWKRKGGPCPECGSERCRSIRSYICWVRSFRRALLDHNYIRCGDQSRHLRAADIAMVLAPQPSGSEALYGPAWAIVLIKALQQEAKDSGRRLRIAHVAEILKSSTSYSPTPAELLARFEELRAFAALRGWRFQHGTWYRS